LTITQSMSSNQEDGRSQVVAVAGASGALYVALVFPDLISTVRQCWSTRCRRASQSRLSYSRTPSQGGHTLAFPSNHSSKLPSQENPKFVSSMSILGSLSFEILDLNSQAQIESALRKHSVDTVISVYSLAPDEWRTQVILHDAAEAAGVRRFAPTSFAFPCDRYNFVPHYRITNTSAESFLPAHGRMAITMLRYIRKNV
jgi:hypothetical protein